MAPRLILVAHAAIPATRRGAFPVDGSAASDDVDVAGIEPVILRAAGRLSAPEARCRRTAQALGWDVEVEPGLADLDVGRWAGRDLADLMGTEPAALHAWTTEVGAAPHGGESLLDLIARVGAVLDGRTWPDGATALVVAPSVVRAAVAHLLGGLPSLMFGIDIAPLSATELTGHGGRWKLRSLQPWPAWVR